jgi:proteasome lid subunit RPN8/RPN11
VRRAVAVQISLSRQARSVVEGAAARAHPRETGGILLGWWEEPAVRVELAVEVPDPDATGHGWTRHERAAQLALDEARRAAEHPWLGYVGDWHTHPAVCDASRNDVIAIRRASRQYDHPLALLVHRADGTFDARAARAGRTRKYVMSYDKETST